MYQHRIIAGDIKPGDLIIATTRPVDPPVYVTAVENRPHHEVVVNPGTCTQMEGRVWEWLVVVR